MANCGVLGVLNHLVSQSELLPSHLRGSCSQLYPIYVTYLQETPVFHRKKHAGWWFQKNIFSIIYWIVLPIDFHIFQNG